MPSSVPVSSPCIRHCTLDETDICVGCYRSLDEILQWSEASNEQRLKILKQSTIRSKKYPGR
ncbi:MAG: DUF1289 domain-containing protein [Pseudomonadales bacterium]|nr:DUF1289 domain-containing protein [Pseudomonadales bacterium]